MKLNKKHKITLFLICVITAAVLCTLPFLTIKKEVIYIYTKSLQLQSKELGFVRELKLLGYKVLINSPIKPSEQDYGLWLGSPEDVADINKNPAKIKFLYTEAYYPADWHGIQNMPIILTPYKELYEHYMRSNIKTAWFTIGVDVADFYVTKQTKKYQLTYYGDDNKTTPLTEILSQEKVKFIGDFWSDKNRIIASKKGDAKERNKALAQSKIVLVYNAPNSPESKRIPDEIMEAAASGTLVFSTFNQAVHELYGDSIIYYTTPIDLLAKKNYFLNKYSQINAKILSAADITAKNISSAATAHRFQEILLWIKENAKN